MLYAAIRYLKLALQLGLLELRAKWVIRVTLRGTSLVEGVTVVWVELNALLDSEWQVRGRDEVTTKDDDDVLALVLLVDSALGGLRGETSSNKDRAGLAPDVNDEIHLLGAFGVGVAVDAGLDNVEVGKVELLEVLSQVGELWDWVLHLHALEAAEWGETDTSLVSTNGLDNGLGDFETEAGTVLDATAPSVGALVAGVLGELINQVSVGTVDLNSVKAGSDCVLGSSGIVCNKLLDLLLGQGLWDWRLVVHWSGARRDQLVAVTLEDIWVTSTAKGPKLAPDEAAPGVDSISDLLPSLDLIFVVDSWNVWVTTGLESNEGGLGDKQSTWDGSSLLVVLYENVSSVTRKHSWENAHP
jgi:hypothetical protein